VSARRDENSEAGGVALEDKPDLKSDGGDPLTDRLQPSKALTVRSPTEVIAPERRRFPSGGRMPTGMAGRDQLDAFRELRTRLVSAPAAAGMSHFTTVVVPVSSGSGASFVARNLAAAFALEERRLAILVDCNLRNPTQHTALGIPNVDRGLFDYLEHPTGGVERLICPTAVPGLHLIPAGHPPSFPREYLSSQAMRMVMNALRQPSCYAFLDSPPAKGAPDARILSDLADFVVLVVCYGRDTSDSIAKTASMFDPAKFAGVVFNEGN